MHLYSEIAQLWTTMEQWVKGILRKGIRILVRLLYIYKMESTNNYDLCDIEVAKIWGGEWKRLEKYKGLKG
jgi:hypothetical protein